VSTWCVSDSWSSTGSLRALLNTSRPRVASDVSSPVWSAPFSRGRALEISPTGVETIEKKGIAELVECAVFDGYEVPFDDDAFDLAILSHVLEHVEYPRKLLYEASRVAEYICVEVPLEDTWRLSADFALDPVGHINFYSMKTIRRLVQSCGLEIVDQRVANPSKGLFLYRDKWAGQLKYLIKECLLRLSPGFATRLFTYHFALVCRRSPGSVHGAGRNGA